MMLGESRFEPGDQVGHFCGAQYTYHGHVAGTDFHHLKGESGMTLVLSTHELVNYEKVT